VSDRRPTPLDPLRVAEMAEGIVEDPTLAERLRGEAAALRERFDAHFWSPSREGYYALGLDGDKRQIDSMTSNMGHLLWSGIVPEERAAIVARHLMSDAMFSGWGGPHPVDRGRGVQPDRLPRRHDLAARQRDRGAGSRPVRLPRGGEPDLHGPARGRGALGPPSARGIRGPAPRRRSVPRPLSDRVQPAGVGDGSAVRVPRRDARHGGSRDGEIRIDPLVPEELGRVFVHGIHAFGTHWDIDATGRNGNVRQSH
jgi:hypothetical protein